MFSKRTRIVLAAFCSVWVLLFTGGLNPLIRLVAAHALRLDGALPQATVPQYLPWTGGRTVHVNQGNNGPRTHSDRGDRYAWDFAVGFGQPILAGAAGEVFVTAEGCAATNSQRCNGGSGNTVSIRLADGTCARFLHLETVAVLPGQKVLQGTPIGTAGSSGHSSGPHLHYAREHCVTRISIPSSFIEAGVPAGGTDVTSQNAPTTGRPDRAG